MYLFVCLFIYLFIFCGRGINMGETLPVCREHVHTGRPHKEKTIAFSKNQM